MGSRLLTHDGDDEFALFIGVDPESYQSVRDLRIQEGLPIDELMARLVEGGAVYVGADVANRFELKVGEMITMETRR